MRVLFIGTGEIGVPTLRLLQKASEHQLVGVVTQPDKPVGRAQKIQSPPIKSILTSSDLPILQPPRIKDAAAIAQIRQLDPEVIVVMAYGQILPRDVLQIPPIACLNLHASLLPRWRGAAPIQAAIASGDRKTGITVMYMAEGLDTGDILLQRKLEIAPTDTGGSLHDRLAEIAPQALAEALRLLSAKTALRIAQDNALASHAPKLHREAGRIDWLEPAAVIERSIRAFNPWPGSFTSVTTKTSGSRKLKIFSAALVDAKGEPGAIIDPAAGRFVIATGDGALSLQEVQLEGKQRMSAAEFVRGNREVALV